MRFNKDPDEVIDLVAKFPLQPASASIRAIDILDGKVLIILKDDWATALEKAGGKWSAWTEPEMFAGELTNSRHIDLVREGMTLRCVELSP